MSSIFTHILQGNMPGAFVYRDDLCFAIMTIQPVQPGHVLVIPVKEVDHWDDCDAALQHHLMDVSTRITKVIKKITGCARVGCMIAGFEVPHTHIHLIPANGLGDLSLEGLAFADPEDLNAMAEKIKAELG